MADIEGNDTALGVRQRNELAALRALHQCGRLSRADLARVLGLNRSSSGHIIAGLAADGLVREVAAPPPAPAAYAHAGRPGILLELVPTAASFLGIEIGVEHITAVEIDLSSRILSQRTEAFDGRAVDVATAVAQAVRFAFDAMPPERLQRCQGVGVAVPAQMNPQGLIFVAPLLGWKDVQLADRIRQVLPVPMPVMVENDANAFAIGASHKSRDSHRGVTLYLVMESGIGGGIMVDGGLFRGGRGLAGEIGHLQLVGNDMPGRSLESVLGLQCILKAYGSVSEQGDAGLALFLEDVRDRVPDAVAIAEEWAQALAFGLIQTCRVIDADRIVLGGSVAALYPLMAARVHHHIRALQEADFPVPLIERNEDETIGPAYGAACILHRRYLSADSPRLADAA